MTAYRLRAGVLIAGLLVLAAPGIASAKALSNEEWQLLSAANKAKVAQLEKDNLAAAASGANPLAAGGIERVGAYDIGDLFAGRNGYELPGWAGIFKAGNPGTAGGTAN